VVTKQQEFLKLEKGKSTIPIRQLEPTAVSFLINIPQAITLSTIRPYPSDVKHILSLAAATEIDLLLLLFIIFLFARTGKLRSKNFIYFCVFFSFSLLLAIGFSVNNLGAIVRYRSILIPLLVVPMVAQIDWKRILAYFGNGIKNKYNMN
jgi:4-amino-4-deoxy-L-arabinose transferase-like glycosyltransferase